MVKKSCSAEFNPSRFEQLRKNNSRHPSVVAFELDQAKLNQLMINQDRLKPAELEIVQKSQRPREDFLSPKSLKKLNDNTWKDSEAIEKLFVMTGEESDTIYRHFDICTGQLKSIEYTDECFMNKTPATVKNNYFTHGG